MKKPLFALLALFTSTITFSQHFYNDIVSNETSNANYRQLKQANIKNVRGVSYEADNAPSENFSLNQELSKDKKRLITTATNTNNVTTITVSHFENDRLVRTADTAGTVRNIVTYEYGANGKIYRIATESVDPQHTGSSSEVHLWQYRHNGAPDFMLQIKNNTDTVRVDFVLDDKGNVAEEVWKWKNRTLNTYYYYYNDQNNLTDIVVYNTKAKKMLPEFTFDYDSSGRISQMMQTIRGSSNYLVWKYTYDEKGLKQKEVCYNKNKQQVGRIEYSYSK